MATPPAPRPGPGKKAAKRALRRDVLARRAAMGEQARGAASAAIHRRLFALPQFQQARGVHCFVSLPGEVETWPIFEACWRLGKQTFLPVQRPQEGVLGCARLEAGDTLLPGPFGVPEPPPQNRRAADLDQIDLVLVPGVAFDRAGWRLGYGKGYYDLFLTSLVKKAGHSRNPAGGGGRARPVETIALAFSGQVVEAVPRERWDVRMALVLTETETIIPA